MTCIRTIETAHPCQTLQGNRLVARISDYWTSGTGHELQPIRAAVSEMAAWMVSNMGATAMNLDLGANGHFPPYRQRPCGCGVVGPYLAANLRQRHDWRTYNGLAPFAVAASTCEDAAVWLGFPQRLNGRVRSPGAMAMLGVGEVQSLAVYYQNYDAIHQETPEQQASWADGYDWSAAHRARANTNWLSQIGTRDYVQRRIAETVRDAAADIHNGTYVNPGVHIAIMNTEDSRSSGLHWILVMYEIRGPA